MNRDFRIIKYFQSKVCHNSKFPLVFVFSGEVCELWGDCHSVPNGPEGDIREI
jgi:hypothetical protein